MQHMAVDGASPGTQGGPMRLAALGTAAREVMRERGHSGRALADKLGITDGHLSRILDGRVDGLAVEMVHELERCLELPAGALLTAGGYVRAGESVRAAIEVDPLLTAEERRIALRVYDGCVEASASARKRSSASKPPTVRSTRRT